MDEQVELHPLLRGRYSPLAFDPDVSLSDRDRDVLLEAARWAPSAGNSQPWAFVFAPRGSEEHRELVELLAPSSRRWAPDASALVVNLVHRRVEGTPWPYSEFADYDVGQAVAHLTLQAHAMGLACRQFRAFDLDGLTRRLSLVDGWDVVSMVAVGRAADSGPGHRSRRGIQDLVTGALTDAATDRR